jgi:23S rRNA pseudouridine1911/1915/1917 synthase
LVEKLATLSRSFIQQAIKAGKVLLNGKQVPVHHFLKTGEVVTIDVVEPEATRALSPAPNVPWKLVAETADYLVVEKPAGVVVHPAAGVHDPTLVEGMLAKYPELVGVGDDASRPGIVHRLDRDVSGLMVVARTPEMFQHLKDQFQARTITKEYLGLVVGRVAQEEGTINFPLARSKSKHGKMAARPESSGDTREAITHYEIVSTYQQTTLLRISLETGRTHQIRAHLAALGYPLVGDDLYHPKKLNFKATPGRLFLHAATLGFTDREGKRQMFTSALPAELDQFLHKLS